MWNLLLKEWMEKAITFDTCQPPGLTNDFAMWLQELAREFGCKTEIVEVEPGAPNFHAELSFGDGPALMLNSHMDVNSPKGQIWKNEPLKPFSEGERLYGLGACDAKGSLISMLAAMRRLALNPCGLHGRIILTAVMGEEAGGIGARHLPYENVHADGCIVGEPTGLRVAVCHKGALMQRLYFPGIAAHSASSHLGVNAIYFASRFSAAYEKLNQRLQQTQDPYLGSPSAQVTLISGGTRQNTVPESAVVTVDRRLNPGEDDALAQREIDQILEAIAKDEPRYSGVKRETTAFSLPAAIDTSDRLARNALDVCGTLLGDEYGAPIGFRAGSDMGRIQRLLKIPTLILGPGSLEQAHKPDEFVDMQQVYHAMLIYEAIARKFLSLS